MQHFRLNKFLRTAVLLPLLLIPQISQAGMCKHLGILAANAQHLRRHGMSKTDLLNKWDSEFVKLKHNNRKLAEGISLATVNTVYKDYPMDFTSQNVGRHLRHRCQELRSSRITGKSLTGPEYNAVRSAKQYINYQPFSRRGLIRQLSSSFVGFSVEDATIAVDSLHINWDMEAVKSAKEYLNLQGYSCRGLIQQLSSSTVGFTVSQATYGAEQAGACQ